MFTLQQIKEAHSKVRSGADFPQYIRDLFSMGILKYTIYVTDGHAEYLGEKTYKIESNGIYPMLKIAPEVNTYKFKEYLKIHQQGHTDYFTFCENCAETGINKWIVDIVAKTCTYYDKSGNLILEENIPI